MASDIKRVPEPDLADPDTEATDPEIAVPRPALPSKDPQLPDLGPLDEFLRDPEVTEIIVNDVRNVMIEREGKMTFAGFSYQTIDELHQLIDRILVSAGRELDPAHPYLDLSLADGSRVNIVAPPLAVNGPCLTIRKFPAQRMTAQDLIDREMFDLRIGYFLKHCVRGRVSLVICGGTGSGKTTLLNALAGLVSRGERIITIEDTPELSLAHSNSVRMRTIPSPSPEDEGVTARELVANALRMRPDRIIIGECRRGEAFDMLQAMNTGHAGSMTTVHANSPRDGMTRIETLCLLADVELPLLAIRKQALSAIDLLIQVTRFRSGQRRITAITEVTGIEGDTLTLQDIFVFEPSPDREQAALGEGRFRCTGYVPTFMERLEREGMTFPKDYFA